MKLAGIICSFKHAPLKGGHRVPRALVVEETALILVTTSAKQDTGMEHGGAMMSQTSSPTTLITCNDFARMDAETMTSPRVLAVLAGLDVATAEITGLVKNHFT